MSTRNKHELFIELRMKGVTLWEGRGDTRPEHRRHDPYPPVQFLPYLWDLGIILLAGQPIIIERWVKMTINRRTAWKIIVPQGAEKKRNALAKEECAVSEQKVELKTIGDSAIITIPNGVTVYAWWKDQGTVRLTATPEDLMVDITPGDVRCVEEEAECYTHHEWS